MQRSIKNVLILATCLSLVQPSYSISWTDWAKNGLQSMVKSFKKAEPQNILAYTILAAAITAGGYYLYRWWYPTNEKLIADADREITNANSALDGMLREGNPRTIINDIREETLSMVAQNMYGIGNKITTQSCQAKLNMAMVNLTECRTQLTKRTVTIAHKQDQQDAHQHMVQQIAAINQLTPVIDNRIYLLYHNGTYFDAYRSALINDEYYVGEFAMQAYTLPALQPYIMNKNATFPYMTYAQNIQNDLAHINDQIARVKASFERTGNAIRLLERLQPQAERFSEIHRVISQSREYLDDVNNHRTWLQQQELLRIERERLAHEKAVEQEKLRIEQHKLYIAQQKANAATLAAQAAMMQAHNPQQQTIIVTH